MLGKLIKYDFKALNRYLIVIHAMLLVTAIMGRFLFVKRMMKNPDSLSEAGAVIMAIGIMIYVILFMTALFGTLLMIAIYFYKNIYSDEGYLTHTLPVSKGQLLAAKTITGSVWMFADIVLVTLSVFILVLYQPIIQEFKLYKDEMLTAMGFPSSFGYGKIFLSVILLLVVSAVSNVVMLYVSIAVGQLFSNHRALGAIVAYFTISMIVSIISGVIGAATGFSVFVGAADEAFMYQFYVRTYLVSMATTLITAVGFYGATYLLMQKKVNLS